MPSTVTHTQTERTRQNPSLPKADALVAFGLCSCLYILIGAQTHSQFVLNESGGNDAIKSRV